MAVLGVITDLRQRYPLGSLVRLTHNPYDKILHIPDGCIGRVIEEAREHSQNTGGGIWLEVIWQGVDLTPAGRYVQPENIEHVTLPPDTSPESIEVWLAS